MVGLFASFRQLYCAVVFPLCIGEAPWLQDSSRLWAVNEASKLFQTSVGDFLASKPDSEPSPFSDRERRVEKMDDKTVKEKSKFIVHVILKNALEQIGVIHVMTCHKLKIILLKVQ